VLRFLRRRKTEDRSAETERKPARTTPVAKASYEDLLVESALLSFVLTERPQGVKRDELTGLHLAGRSRSDEKQAIDRAIAKLADARLLRVEADLVLPGPLYDDGLSYGRSEIPADD
jgi:hypothetical protein